MNIALRIITALAVVAILSLYLYDDGAHRVYDVIISAVVIVATLPLFGVFAAVSKIKIGRVFEEENGLRFAFPENALNKLPWFMLVFIGRANILPKKLFGRKKSAES